MNSNKFLPMILLCVLSLYLVSCNFPSSGSELPVVDDSPPLSTTGPVESPPQDVSGNASCLSGTFVMETSFLDLLVATLVPGPDIHVPAGQLTMSFDPSNGTYIYDGDFTIKVFITPGGESYMEALGGFQTNGAFSVEGDMIAFDLSNSEEQVLQWHAVANGQDVTVPGGGPSFSLLPPANAPFRCTAEGLEIDTMGSGGVVTMFFTR